MRTDWAVFIVAQDSAEAVRADIGTGAVDLVARCVLECPWSDEAASAPHDVRVQNLYSAGTDARGVSLWAVTFSQSVELDGDVPVGVPLQRIVWELDDPETSVDPDIESVLEIP